MDKLSNKWISYYCLVSIKLRKLEAWNLDEPMVRSAHTLVSNGGPSRAGEKRKDPRLNRALDKSRDPKVRKLDSTKRSEKRQVENLEHIKNGLYECGRCSKVKPESLFPQHIPTSGKFSRYEWCEKCLDTNKAENLSSGVTQFSRDRNATRSIGHQLNIKASLKGKPGFEEYEAECDAANPPKTAQMFKIRCTKEEMVEKLPLVGHGLVDSFHSNCFS